MKNDSNPLPLKGGVDHFNAGRLEAAEAAFRQVLERSPDHPDALHLLGLTLSRMGRNEDGADYVRRALDKQPGNSAFRKNLSQILMQMRDIEGATDCYERVLAAEPGDVEVLIQSGILKAMAGDVAGGDERLRRAAAPADPRPRYNLGVMRLENGEPEKAAEYFRETVHLAPKNWEAYLNWGRALTDLGKPGAALEVYRRAAELQPNNPLVLNNLGLALLGEDSLETSIEHLQCAIQAAPQFAEAHCDLGLVYRRAGRLEEAERVLVRALELDPKSEKGLATLGTIRFMQGDLAEAWDFRCRRFERPGFGGRYAAWPLWRGEDLAGKTILVWGDQGVGDEILFASMLPDLAASGGRVLFHCDDRMVPVYGRSLPAVTAVSRDTDPEAAAGNPIDYQIPLEGLGVHFRQSIDSIPEIRSIITADPDLTEKKRAAYRQGDDLTLVGISWLSTNRELGKDKAIDLAKFSALPLGPNVRLVDLQYGDTAEQRQSFERETGHAILHDDGFDQLRDLESFAAQVAAMDAVVSVSSTTAHFAGGLGVPAFVMLNTAPLHYWFLDREDSPWYPSLRLFRQDQRGHWDGVLAAVGEALQSAINDTGSR